MAGETSKVAQLAEVVSKELFHWFKWESVGPQDNNFSCCKVDKHTQLKKEKHTHPVDVVFHYFDPYLNKRVLLNTDLKSYKKGSITSDSVRKALKSLAQSIDCARVSGEWKTRYGTFEEAIDIRGLLFTYNHCGEYDKDFFDFFRRSESDKKRKIVRTESLPIQKNQQIHVFDPALINYLTTVTLDMSLLCGQKTLDIDDYCFFYPELQLTKVKGRKSERPLTVEMITSPFFIIEHGPVKAIKGGEIVESYKSGHIVYFNRPGSSHLEFVYLFDLLAKYQILDLEDNVRIRVACSDYHSDIRSNFERAKAAYAAAWGYDDFKKERLDSISFELLQTKQKLLSPIDVGWRV
ncbi:hypothetical protein KUV56_08840 [Ferrimonas balearica]|uniref:hypothetical protein n=1 Tax=Ferrimonas balearica TaxID=44012 RepID=UPI001C56EA5C|nr:hypothetical protein [Ferrimonas balearica]MBW3139621.1 hypothetical protein [Ferrimonas balearica]